MKNFSAGDQPSQTLAKGLLVLEKFNSKTPDWGVRELAREMDENHGTIHRILKTLSNAGYLSQDESTKRYSLGSRVLKLANEYIQENPLPSIALEVFKKYSDRFEYNFYLGKINNFEVIYLSVLDGRGRIQIMIDPGATLALHTTALGKALLAFKGDDFIREYIETIGLDKFTEKTISDSGLLQSQLSEIRKQKYAVNIGEHYKGIGAVGVPIINNDGIAELGISLAYPQQFVETGQIKLNRVISLAQNIANHIKEKSSVMLNQTSLLRGY